MQDQAERSGPEREEERQETPEQMTCHRLLPTATIEAIYSALAEYPPR